MNQRQELLDIKRVRLAEPQISINRLLLVLLNCNLFIILC